MCNDSIDKKCRKEESCLCSARGIIEVVSKKWTVCIVSILERDSPIRYNEIKAKLKDISPKSLSDTLKVLRKEDLIERKVFPEIPPRVEYSLTGEGQKLKGALMPLVEWAKNRDVSEGREW